MEKFKIGVALPYNKMIDTVFDLNEDIIRTRVYSRALDAIGTSNFDIGLKFLSLFRLPYEKYVRLLFIAILYCDNGKETRVVKMLIDQGVPVDTLLHNGKPSLFTAIKHSTESSNVVRYLLERGANVRFRHEDGLTDLHFAVFENVEVVRLLCEFGADLNARCTEGRTPLMFAITFGTFDVMKVLVEAGAKVHDADNCGRTPLMYAARKAEMEKLIYLLDRSPNLDLQDSVGWTCLIYAARNKEHSNVVRLLLERGASPHVQSQTGASPLMWVVNLKSPLEVIADLIRYSGNTRFAKTINGRNVMDWAIHDQASLSVFVCLTEAGCIFDPEFYRFELSNVSFDPEITAYLKRYPLHHLRALCSHLRSEMADFASGEAARPLLPKAVVFRDEALPLDNLFLLPYVHVLDGVTRFREDCAREEFYQVEPREMDATVEDVRRTLKGLARVVEMNELVRAQLLSECAEHNARVLVRITDGEPNAKRARIENTHSE